MSLNPPPPPPRRINSPRTSTPDPAPSTWKDKMKAKGSVWGKYAVEKGVKISDNLGGKVNGVAERRFGTEAFWPVTGDFPKEMDKCARILRAFTVDGVVTEEKTDDPAGGKDKKKRKVIRKIPPAVIAQAKGLAIFTSMRTGIAPLGGAGGAGVVVAKLPDGTWSGPASISPNNISTGFLLGVDVYDCVLVIRSQKALDSFATHKATLGAELGVAAGPFGAGAAVEAGKEKAPLFSYVRSRGLYAGVEVVGQVFVERFEENAAMYNWPGVKAGDILAGKTRIPIEATKLHEALRDAESGVAQALKGDALDIVIPEGATELELQDGEVLKLPPTPDMTTGHEHESDPETELVHRASRPGSHNPSISSMNDVTGSGGRVHRVPPPLPSRNPARPALDRAHSSASHYSDPLDSPAPGTQGEALPAYADPASESTAGAYPAEKRDGAGLTEGAVGTDGEPMTEAEKREWEEYYLAQGGGVSSAVYQTAGTAGANGNEVFGLSDRLQDTHLASEKGKESESLR
ncbi:hypothetical protein IAT38_007139 [Cryptococcus sp. DSM 104549]